MSQKPERCKLVADGEGSRCTVCGEWWGVSPRAAVVCGTKRCRVEPPPYGAGSRLAETLRSIGIEANEGCACKSMAAKMDTNGPEWCLENIEEITGVMRVEAERRGLPFSNLVARALVRRAVRATVRARELTEAKSPS